MSKYPNISVIVPVYNAEKYLETCINSILSQIYQDFELLLIDDGSTDNSGRICDKYALLDKRVKVFHKVNGGVSSARNLGLEHIKGEWVVFIDSDDTITKDFLSIDNQLDKVDVIQKSFITVDESTNQKKYYSVHNNILSSQNEIFRYFVQKRTNALWDKIISKRVIKNLRFNEDVTIGEDFLFFLSVLKNVKTYAFSSIGNYIYFIRNGSAMQKVNANLNKRIQILYDNLQLINEVLSENNYDTLRNGIVYSTYIMKLCLYRKRLDSDQYQILKKYLQQLKWKHLKYASIKDKLKLFMFKYFI